MYCSLVCSVGTKLMLIIQDSKNLTASDSHPNLLYYSSVPRRNIKLSIYGPIPCQSLCGPSFFSMNWCVRAWTREGPSLTPPGSRSKAPDCLCLFRRENLVDLGSWKLEACRAGPDEELIYSWSRLVISGWICAADGFFFSPEPTQETGKLPDTCVYLRVLLLCTMVTTCLCQRGGRTYSPVL